MGVGAVITLVVTLAVWLPDTKFVVEDTLAVLTMEEPEVFVSTRVWAVIVILPPTYSVSIVPVKRLLLTTTLPPIPPNISMCHAPLKITPVGRTSWITTFCAAAGPEFVTTMV